KSDVSVLVTCFALTIAFDMVIGVSVGMLLASLLFMRRMAEVTRSGLSGADSGQPNRTLPDGVLAYEISGPLFFGATQKAMAALEVVGGDTRALILIIDGVNAMDATGLVALESAIEQLRRTDCAVLLVGV